MPLLWSHRFESDDTLGGSPFPHALPEPIDAKGRERACGPEAPDPELVQAFITKAPVRPRRARRDLRRSNRVRRRREGRDGDPRRWDVGSAGDPAERSRSPLERE